MCNTRLGLWLEICTISLALVNTGSEPAPKQTPLRPSTALNENRDAIHAVALSHRVTNVRVFGSTLHGDDTESSDLDLLVDPTPETTLMDIARIQVELSDLLDVGVDLLTPNALPANFRDQVLKEALPT